MSSWFQGHAHWLLNTITIKCWPFYSPREFTSILFTAVYIPPQAKAAEALEELYTAISGYEDKYPQAVPIAAGDFNHCSLKSVLPKYYLYVSCPTRGNKILDHCYSTNKGVYRSVPQPHFGKSDHCAYATCLQAGSYKTHCEDCTTLVRRWWTQTTGLFENNRLGGFQGPSEPGWLCCVETCPLRLSTFIWIRYLGWMAKRKIFMLYKEARYALRSMIKSAKDQQEDFS